jgi:hypothetical protein
LAKGAFFVVKNTAATERRDDALPIRQAIFVAVNKNIRYDFLVFSTPCSSLAKDNATGRFLFYGT